MLEVQKFLLNSNLEQLKCELGITAKHHGSDPLVILNYSQIESPKHHPIVKECRGLILNNQDYSLVARSFPRFFNYGEVLDTNFDFSNCNALEKLDGSLVILYYYNGWKVNTRGSFATEIMQNLNFTWKELIEQALGSKLSNLKLDPNITYICELVSPYNKIVRYYPEPKMYLLTRFQGEIELPYDSINEPYFLAPQQYTFSSAEEVINYLDDCGQKDPTFEGVVLRDKNNNRFKFKSLTYVSLHYIRGNGDTLFSPKNIIKHIFENEGDELLTYFPEVKDIYFYYKSIIEEQYVELEKLYHATRGIEDQKEFALSILGKSPYTQILFNLRKHKSNDLYAFWRESKDLILKVILNKVKLNVPPLVRESLS